MVATIFSHKNTLGTNITPVEQEEHFRAFVREKLPWALCDGESYEEVWKKVGTDF